jgi:hypothetical protein
LTIETVLQAHDDGLGNHPHMTYVTPAASPRHASERTHGATNVVTGDDLPVVETPASSHQTMIRSAIKKDVKSVHQRGEVRPSNSVLATKLRTVFSLAVTRIHGVVNGRSTKVRRKKSILPAPPKAVGKRTIKSASTAGNCFPPFHSGEVKCP